MPTAQEVFEQYDKLNEKGFRTYGSQGDAMRAIQQISLTDPDEALKLAALYVEGASAYLFEVANSPEEIAERVDRGEEVWVSRERATEITKINIGYICGYYGPELARFWYPAIDTQHPIFGQIYPTPEAAFEAGEKLAEG